MHIGIFYEYQVMTNAAQYFKIGLIMKPHGLKGDVTIAVDPDVPIDFDTIDSVFIEINNAFLPYFIEDISVRGDKAFVKFEDVDDPESAKKISKRAIYLPKSARPKSAKGAFYDDEIIGFDVSDETLGPLGKIIGVTQTGLNKLIVVERNDKEILIPVNSPLIVSVHKSTRKILVNLPEGYLDI